MEHDLAICLDKDDKFVKDLQESKWIKMWEFTKNATYAKAKKIFYHENFKCLKDLVDE
ncbi:hypothetical protein AO382_0703 [Moraxella catarrhalis]|uniref:Uncharacterized protein n=1 Tax=Moraxella catarrhalis TaxID=480 RepID=A0A7Z0UZC6_MORCA|nr:hypothetical protein AO382_0703 [Moraxella catarrhalis]